MSGQTGRDCPCCGAPDEFGEDGSFDICQTCWWEDDPVQNANPDWPGGANRPSLQEARRHFQMLGICDPALKHVKPQLPG